MKKMMIRLLGLVIVAGSLSACTTTVGVGGGSDPYYRAWYDVYGTYCNNGYPMSGCNFYSDGSKITASEDPYYSNMTLYFDYWTYTDSYGYRRNYNGYAWLSSTGILYDSYGNALNEMDQEEVSSVDVLSLAAKKEKAVQKAVGKSLAQKYALNEDKGIMISKTLQDWAGLGKNRARTSEDMADFSKRLYGLDAQKTLGAFKSALATQSQKPIEELNVDVAAHWGTSPEVSKQILMSWYKDEVSNYGIK
jgi:hypothetical protein